MSKTEDFLNECKNNIGKWTCSLHTTGSNQPAAIFREVKKLGYEFEEATPNRWAKTMYCPICKQETTHYKLFIQSFRFPYYAHSLDSLNKKKGISTTPLN